MLDNFDTEELFHLKSRIKTQSDLIEEFIVIDNGREISLKKCEKELLEKKKLILKLENKIQKLRFTIKACVCTEKNDKEHEVKNEEIENESEEIDNESEEIEEENEEFIEENKEIEKEKIKDESEVDFRTYDKTKYVRKESTIRFHSDTFLNSIIIYLILLNFLFFFK